MRNPEPPTAPQSPLVSILLQGDNLIASILTALDDSQLQRFQTPSIRRLCPARVMLRRRRTHYS